MKNTYDKVRGMLPEGSQSLVKELMRSSKKEEEVKTVNTPQLGIYNGSITLYLHGTGFSAYRTQHEGKQYLTLQVGTSDKKIRKVPNEFKVDVQPMKFTVTSVKGTKQSLGSVVAMIEDAAPYNPNTKTGLSRREAPVVAKSKNTSKAGAKK